jgi:oxaloacetate decarboxylase beta subunit
MEETGLLNFLYKGIEYGIYPLLIFLGVGASTDFGPLIANPKSLLLGAAGVSAVPMTARVVHKMGLDEDNQNFLLMHAMGPNVAGVIGSAIAAGIFLNLFT